QAFDIYDHRGRNSSHDFCFGDLGVRARIWSRTEGDSGDPVQARLSAQCDDSGAVAGGYDDAGKRRVPFCGPFRGRYWTDTHSGGLALLETLAPGMRVAAKRPTQLETKRRAHHEKIPEGHPPSGRRD